MHGAILRELEKVVTQQHGAHAWREVQRRPDLPSKIYVTSGTYPDSHVVALVSATSDLTGTPAPVRHHSEVRA